LIDEYGEETLSDLEIIRARMLKIVKECNEQGKICDGDRRIIEGLVEGKTREELAEENGITVRTIYRRLNKLAPILQE
jgi:hypothetical protein